jgi:phosphoribosylglycinamide formyltransferase-1
MARLRLGVLISGRGSNLQALIEACAEPAFPAAIALVVSNRKDAAGLARATEAGIPTEAISLDDAVDRDGFEAAIDAALRTAGIELVCLAGFMRVLSAAFVARWRDRLVNIHPSLLPAFPGLDTHRRALAAGVRFSGATVHFVRAEIDAGPIIIQAAVPVLDDDDEAALAARVLAAEHRIYPAAVRLIAEGRVRIVAGRVAVTRPGAAPPPVAYPGVDGASLLPSDRASR